MGQDLSQVTVNRKQAIIILEQARPRLVERLKNGMQRDDANREVADWLRNENNILSPYADEVVAGLYVSPKEIEMRLKYGDKVAEGMMEIMQMMNKKQ